jgi:hypothetical protein
MGDLADALREAGHGDVAAALEKKELAARLRKSGRPDLADQLEAGDQPAPEAEETPPPAPQPHELLAERLNAAQSRWTTLGGPDDGKAA